MTTSLTFVVNHQAYERGTIIIPSFCDITLNNEDRWKEGGQAERQIVASPYSHQKILKIIKNLQKKNNTSNTGMESS